MVEQAAGLLLYRGAPDRLEVLLVHPGGPLWARKDDGAWSIPKGLIEPGEEPLAAARRELTEETGFTAIGEPIVLPSVHPRRGKLLHAWAVHQDVDPAALTSNTFCMEWPPRSGRQQEFPEVDRAAWSPLDVAMQKILPGQRPLLESLANVLAAR